MLYFFDAVLGQKRIKDPEGGEFENAESARAEAAQIAREIAAEESRNGNKIGCDWRIEVLNQTDVLVAHVGLQDVLFGMDAKPETSSSTETSSMTGATSAGGFLEHYLRSKALFEESRALTAQMRRTFQEIRSQLADLG
jgi:hypothetical protein